MADSTISQLPPAVSLNSTDVVPLDQGGVTKRATIAQVSAMVGAFPPGTNYAMGGHKFTGLGLGSIAGDSVPYEQVGAVSRLDEPKFAGFMNSADVTLAWNNTTRTLTVSPTAVSFQFYSNGIIFTKSITENIQIPNVSGSYYFYYDVNGTLQVTTTFTFDLILTFSFLAMLNWNASTGLAVPDAMLERHQASMPAIDHLYAHETLGTAYDSRVGGLLPAVTADGDGSLDAHIEFSATPGAIWDEDVEIIIPVKQLLDNIPILYKTGAAGVWTFDATSPTMVRTVTGLAAYNQFTGGAWQLTQVTDGNFLLMHLYAIPGFTTRWMMIMGLNQYATLIDASNAALTEILTITGVPLAEFKAIASFAIQTSSTYTNSVKSRVRLLNNGAAFIDWRHAQVGGAGASGTGGNVVGPVGATNNDIAVFDGATGTLIKDGGTPTAIIGTAIHGATNKPTPVDADEVSIWDSVGLVLNKVTWANAKATLKTYFDTLYAALAGSASQVFSVALATLGTHTPRASQLIGRNLVVNGSCVIDQVNSGALITPINGGYPIDNVFCGVSQASKLQSQQVVSSTSLFGSLGSVNALTWSVLSQYTPLVTDTFSEFIPIEGLNFARLRWGTVDALPVSLQFKIRSSVTGVYSGSIKNAAGNRSYPFSFTVAAGDNLITIPNIPGDTSGTWLTTNVTAAYVCIDLGSGANLKSTAGSWQAGNFVGVTGTTNLVAQVNGSTLSITDVQLEQGTFCTTFERKLYDQDFSECQRYFQGFIVGNGQLTGIALNTTLSQVSCKLSVQMRIETSALIIPALSNFSIGNGAVSGTPTNLGLAITSKTCPSIQVTTTAGSPTLSQGVGITLTVGASGYIYFNARI